VRLLDDEILLKTLSDNGCQKIAEFEWEKSCDQLISLFKEGHS